MTGKSAVLEAPFEGVVKTDQEPPLQPVQRAYEMPEVEIGDVVRFWPDGQRNKSRGELGSCFSISQNGRNINIRILSSGQARYGVRHIDDPRLNDNQEMRAEGAWEHGTTYLKIKALEEKVAKLEAALA